MTEVSEARRRQILDAAAVCFARRGFHQATMQDICKAVVLSPGSVYRYFRSKDDIIVALIDEERRQTALLLEKLGDDECLIDGFRTLLSTVFAAMNESATFAMHAEVAAEALRNPVVRERVRTSEQATVNQLAETLRSRQQNGSVAAEIDPVPAAEIIMAMVDGLWWQKALQPSTDIIGYADTVASFIERLLRPVKP